MPGILCKNKLPEILINGYQDALLGCGLFQESPVPWIGAPFARFGCIVSLVAQPLGNPRPGTSINQEFHGT